MLHAKTFQLEKIGIQSPLQGNIVMRPGGGTQALGTLVGIWYAHQDCPIHLTVIPAHVIILIELECMRTEVRGIRTNLRSDLR